MMTCQDGCPPLPYHGQAPVEYALSEASHGDREQAWSPVAASSSAGVLLFRPWSSWFANPTPLEMTEMKPTSRYRVPRVGRRLKHRITLASMVFCLAVCGALVAFRGLKPATHGSAGGEDALTHFGGLGTTLHGDVFDENARFLAGSSSCTNTLTTIGEMILYLFGVLYCFVGLAIVCDEYFQASLEKISEVLKLTPDVAGATFLAAGSSAPELFTSLTDAFGDSNSTGTGTIVGSAMFNILVIVALSAAVAGSNNAIIEIDWRPVCRDVTFYSYSILVLTLVFLDSKVEWWEGLIMFLSYGVYITFMAFNSRILKICDRCDKGKRKGVPGIAAIENPQRNETGPGTRGYLVEHNKAGRVHATSAKPDIDQKDLESGSHSLGEDGADQRKTKIAHQHGNGHRPDDPMSLSVSVSGRTEGSQSKLMSVDPSDKGRKMSKRDAYPSPDFTSDRPDKDITRDNIGGSQSAVPDKKEESIKPQPDEEEDDDEDDAKVFFWPKKRLDQFMYILGFPYRILLFITVPTERWGSIIGYWYTFAFLMSLFWIGVLTHYMVEWVTAVGCYLDVSPIFMGLVVLAVGTSVPDALGSMIAARNGEANMAIANAIGSNVFDILFGLGLPWLLSTLWFDEPAPVDRGGIALNVVILFCTAILFVMVLKCNGWTMTTRTGMFLFVLYVLYIIEVVVVEVLT